MNSILIVDDAAVCREPVAAALRQQGFQTFEARGGDEALAVLREHRPDLMLLDLIMPQPDGLAVLRAVRRNPTHRDLPVILLTDASDREHILQAAERGIQGYLLKSQFSLAELFRRIDLCLHPRPKPAKADRVPAVINSRPEWPEPQAGGQEPQPNGGDDRELIRRRLAQPYSLESLKPVIAKEDLIRLVNQGLELRPLGPVVGQVVSVTNSAQCTAEDVAKVVMQDQALSIRLLKLANSSAYSRGHAVDSVRDAVHRIGTNEIRSLVMTLGVVEQYQEALAAHLDPRSFWEHSITCGVIASAIAELRHSANTDEYFLWGVLHDVGRIIMVDHAPEAYAQVLQAADTLNLPLEMVEPRLVLLDHCDILERAMEYWQFPRDFIIPVANHHQSMPRIRRLGPQHEHAAATIALADRLAHALMLGSSGNDVIYPVDELVAALRLPAEAFHRLAALAIDEATNLKVAMLARVDEENWPDACGKIRGLLCRPICPLFTGSNADLDTFRVFFDRLASKAEPLQQNVGVIHLAHLNEQASVFEQYRAAETAAECGELPLLIISGKGGVQGEDAFLSARRHIVLSSAVRIDRLIAAINELLQ